MMIAAYKLTALSWLACSEGRWPRGAVLHLSGELVEIWQMSYREFLGS